MVDNLILAQSAKEAARLKGSNNKSAYLAGGTEINRLGSTINARTLISIGRIEELDGIREEDGAVLIGSMCTFQDIIESPLTPAYLKEACLFMGSRTKRNMATIGGNIALRRTDSYLYATLLACAAKLTLMNKSGKTETRCVLPTPLTAVLWHCREFWQLCWKIINFQMEGLLCLSALGRLPVLIT